MATIPTEHETPVEDDHTNTLPEWWSAEGPDERLGDDVRIHCRNLGWSTPEARRLARLARACCEANAERLVEAQGCAHDYEALLCVLETDEVVCPDCDGATGEYDAAGCWHARSTTAAAATAPARCRRSDPRDSARPGPRPTPACPRPRPPRPRPAPAAP